MPRILYLSNIFNSSFAVSISARLLKHILSAILISEFFILFLTFFNNTPSLSGSLSSTPPVVNTKLRISPLSFMTRCSLKPKLLLSRRHSCGWVYGGVFCRLVGLRALIFLAECQKTCRTHLPNRKFQ